MGAGVLPVALHQGQLYFLFGQEQDTKEWSDFGGGRQGTETPLQNAVREATEELNGFFGKASDVRKLIRENLVHKIHMEPSYTSFVVKVDYDPMLPKYFANNHAFMRCCLRKQVGEDGLFEKAQIEWMSVAQLRRRRKQFRGFYQNIVAHLLAAETLATLKKHMK